MEKQFAFLNRIYTEEDDVTKYYEVIFSTLDYTRYSLYRTDLEGLKQLTEDPALIRDFSFEGDYLKCFDIPRVWSNSVIEKSIGKELVFLDSVQDTVMDLLQLGVENNFYVVDDEICEEDSWVGNGIVSFRKIRFSKSSMSVYVRMVLGTKMKNLYIVRMEKGVLTVQPFKFAVPDSSGIVPFCARFIKNIEINNVGYRLYEAEDMEVFKDVQILSAALINKAVCSSEVILSSINVFTYYLSMFCQEDQKLSWNGCTDSAKENRGVRFKCSNKHLTKKDAVKIFKLFTELRDGSDNLESFREKLIATTFTRICKVVLLQLAGIAFRVSTTAELVSSLQNFIKQASVKLFYTDLFLHKVRIYMYYTNQPVMHCMNVLYGSNEEGFTIVEEGISYDI